MAIIGKKTVLELQCNNCGHIWLSRKPVDTTGGILPKDLPDCCPKCHNISWNSGSSHTGKTV